MENKIDRILTADDKNFCMRCHHLSYNYAEIDTEDEADVVCPKCFSQYYMIATKEEEKRYGQ